MSGFSTTIDTTDSESHRASYIEKHILGPEASKLFFPLKVNILTKELLMHQPFEVLQTLAFSPNYTQIFLVIANKFTDIPETILNEKISGVFESDCPFANYRLRDVISFLNTVDPRVVSTIQGGMTWVALGLSKTSDVTPLTLNELQALSKSKLDSFEKIAKAWDTKEFVSFFNKGAGFLTALNTAVEEIFEKFTMPSFSDLQLDDEEEGPFYSKQNMEIEGELLATNSVLSDNPKVELDREIQGLKFNQSSSFSSNSSAPSSSSHSFDKEKKYEANKSSSSGKEKRKNRNEILHTSKRRTSSFKSSTNFLSPLSSSYSHSSSFSFYVPENKAAFLNEEEAVKYITGVQARLLVPSVVSEEERVGFIRRLAFYEKLARQAMLTIKDKKAIDNIVEEFETILAKQTSLTIMHL